MFLSPGSQSPAESLGWAVGEKSAPAQDNCGQEMTYDSNGCRGPMLGEGAGQISACGSHSYLYKVPSRAY